MYTRTEVPSYTPATALKLFRLYLDNSWFDPAAFRPCSDGGEKEVGSEQLEQDEQQQGQDVQQQEEREQQQKLIKASLRRHA